MKISGEVFTSAKNVLYTHKRTQLTFYQDQLKPIFFLLGLPTRKKKENAFYLRKYLCRQLKSAIVSQTQLSKKIRLPWCTHTLHTERPGRMVPGQVKKKVGQKARKHLLTKRFMIEGQKKLGHIRAIKLHEVLNRSNYSNYCQLVYTYLYSIVRVVSRILSDTT